MTLAELVECLTQAGATSEILCICVKFFSEQEDENQKRRIMDAQRSARYRKNGGGKIPQELRVSVFQRDEFTCVYCGSMDNLQCDHDVPVSKGGQTTFENLLTACRICNAKKRDRDRKSFQGISWNSREIVGKSSEVSEQKEIPPTPPKEKTLSVLSSVATFSERIRRERVSVAGQDDANFDVFYKKFPLHVGKRAAKKAFTSALKRVEFDKILAGLDRYVTTQNPEFYCHPATWLNGDRWLDEPKLNGGNGHGQRNRAADRAHELAEQVRQREFEIGLGRQNEHERGR